MIEPLWRPLYRDPRWALPAAGNTTPATYMVNGRQYIVIACGGGKNDVPSGGSYVAFALPERR